MWYTTETVKNYLSSFPKSKHYEIIGPPYRIQLGTDRPEEVISVLVRYKVNNDEDYSDIPKELITIEQDSFGSKHIYATGALCKISFGWGSWDNVERSPKIKSVTARGIRLMDDVNQSFLIARGDDGKTKVILNGWVVTFFDWGEKGSGEGSIKEKDRHKRIFISYSHKDREFLDILKTNLKVLERKKILTCWDDTRIRTGSKWRREIQRAIDSADAAILMVSPDFLASDFIADNELPPILEAAEKRGLVILWIAVRASLYSKTDIADYQAANDPSRPLNSLSTAELDQEVVRICEKIEIASQGINLGFEE